MKSSIFATGHRRARARMQARARSVDKELRGAMQRAVLVVEGETVKRTSVDRGKGRASIATRIEGRLSRLRGIIFSRNVPYMLWMEIGRKAGKMPPVKLLQAWARRKGMTNPKSAGFLVARKIAQQGTKGRWMFRDGRRAAMPRVRALFRQAWSRINRGEV